MKFIYHNKSNAGGVYRILNIQNGRVYIGSAHSFKKRWLIHQRQLLSNNHHCKFLQRDFDKCGTDAFICEVVEVVDDESLDKKQAKESRFNIEQREINKTLESNKSLLYNGHTKVRRISYKPHTEKRKEFMSVLMTEMYKDPERLKQASDYSKKRWEGHSANITVTNKKTGESVLIDKPIKVWCEERGLNYKAFHLMVLGKTKSSGGWFLGSSEPNYVSQKGQKRKPLSKEHRAKIAGGKYKDVILTHQDTGKTMLVGENIRETCRTTGISYSSLQKMLSGDCKSACGWKVS